MRMEPDRCMARAGCVVRIECRSLMDGSSQFNSAGKMFADRSRKLLGVEPGIQLKCVELGSTREEIC